MRHKSLSNLIFGVLMVTFLGFGGCGSPITFTFPAGVTCTQPKISVTANASAFGGGTTQGKLKVKVCVTCSGTAVAGASVNMDLSELAEVPLPQGITIPPSLAGVTMANGCFEYSLPLRNILDETIFKGLKVPYVVQDASTPPKEITSGTATVIVGQ